ncbi:MAG: DUF4179 domain-containing protein [Psychrobacillus sp.]
MFEEEKQKLEKRKSKINQVEIPLDRLQMSVKSGFEKAKQEKKRKRIITQRSLWSVAMVAILFIAFVTSVNVSPAFAYKVAAIPGLDRVVALIQNDKGLLAAVENNIYQPLNTSQTEHGITVTLDGVIADKKGIVVFYTVESKEKDLSELGYKYWRLKTNNRLPYQYSMEINNQFYPLTTEKGLKTFSSSHRIEARSSSFQSTEEYNFEMGIINGNTIENFKIPFSYKQMNNLESKTITVNKEVEIEGQIIELKFIVVDPTGMKVFLETKSSNTKKFLHGAFNNIQLVDEKGREWSAYPDSYYWEQNKFTVSLPDSFYFYSPKKLTLKFGKVAAMDKDEAYLLIDTNLSEFKKQPKDSIFSDLKIDNNKGSFTIHADRDKKFVYFPKITNERGEEYTFKYDDSPYYPSSQYVTSSFTDLPDGKTKFEFQIPPNSKQVKLDLDFYPSWIEDENVKIEIDLQDK